MLRTLSRRLAAVLLALFVLLGALFATALLVTLRLHEQEVTQRFNRSLASHLAAGRELLRDGRADGEAVGEIFNMLMVVNPAIEIYLLGPAGEILSFSAPPGKVRSDRVDLGPVRRFLEDPDAAPVLGDDPRDPGGRKIFSAAALPGPGGDLEGYLYVILGGEAQASSAGTARGGAILRIGLAAIGAGLLFALLAGLVLFHQLTRRLRRLAAEVERYRDGGFATGVLPGAPRSAGGDEIDRLGAAIREMAARIGEQFGALREADRRRRELVTNLSHDLRTPLASLTGYLETLQMKGDGIGAPERAEHLATALAGARELERRIRGLLELARLDAPDLRLEAEDFPPDELADAVLGGFRVQAARRRVSLAAEIPEGLPLVRADIALARRALENLVDNALRHTPPGGRVTVSLERRAPGVGFRVSDTGPGIPAADLERILERHVRIGGAGRGEAGSAGLGLPIAKRIAELHGGELVVESTPGRGSSFAIMLPAAG